MKKNVWIMNHYAGNMPFEKGGRHYKFAEYLARGGYAPVVFCCNAKHNPSTESFYAMDTLWEEHICEDISVPFVYIRGRTYRGNGKQRILNMLDFYRNLKKTAKEYAKKYEKPDIILASSVHPLTLVAGLQLAKYFGVKCICEIRDLWPESIVAYGIAGPRNPAVIALRWLEKWIYQKADALIFTMEGAYDYIVERGWERAVPRQKVHFINNGVDLDQFRSNRDCFRISDPDLENPDCFKVVYAGSVRKVNNLGLVLDTAKAVKNPAVRFLIWGDGTELEDLKQKVRDENISNVVFKGHVEKQYVPYIVSCADLNFAHNAPSELLRFGISFNKLFDYLAAGKTILCDFPCPYNPAVMMGAAIQVDTPSPENIAQAIDAFSCAEKGVSERYEENARNAALHYDFSNLTKVLIGIIES